jgi:hypothetical protein
MTMAFTYTNSSTFNLETVLRANILGSDYYNKTCLEMSRCVARTSTGTSTGRGLDILVLAGRPNRKLSVLFKPSYSFPAPPCRTHARTHSWEVVVDEIYECVEDVEPWMSGNARGPSTAFSLMHRLLTLGLNTKQIKDTINHQDSPYIRAVSECCVALNSLLVRVFI